uniref:Uncharacterized protein n=1 Tax=Ditylenchus dipsaci TaxID=166011 RepID=A0A915DLV6_9BILA
MEQPTSNNSHLPKTKEGDPTVAKQDEAQFRLIHQYSFCSVEEAENCRSFANFSKKLCDQQESFAKLILHSSSELTSVITCWIQFDLTGEKIDGGAFCHFK